VGVKDPAAERLLRDIFEDRCECCDLPVSSCGKAAEQRQRAEHQAERARISALPGVFMALYAGTCGGCGERYDPRTLIRSTSGGCRAECCL
jgi:hypothetical protein